MAEPFRVLIVDDHAIVRAGVRLRTSYDGLTDREREVLRLVAEGQTTGEILDSTSPAMVLWF